VNIIQETSQKADIFQEAGVQCYNFISAQLRTWFDEEAQECITQQLVWEQTSHDLINKT